MSRRAVSTVLDVALALVVVSAAVLTLTTVPGGSGSPDGDAADELAAVVATSTVEVEYDVQPPDGPRLPDPYWHSRRTTNGTLATLLAEAAVGDAAFEGDQLSPATDGFERAVRNATRRTVGGGDVRVQVRAVWRPFPGASLRGRFVAGAAPPPDADVHAATLTVPGPTSGIPNRTLLDASEEGYRQLAEVIAGRTVAALFPTDRSRRALSDPGTRRAIVVQRYVRTARHLDWITQMGVRRAVATGNATVANALLVESLAGEFATTLRQRYDSPSAAAEAVSVGVVVVAVRTWSP